MKYMSLYMVLKFTHYNPTQTGKNDGKASVLLNNIMENILLYQYSIAKCLELKYYFLVLKIDICWRKS